MAAVFGEGSGRGDLSPEVPKIARRGIKVCRYCRRSGGVAAVLAYVTCGAKPRWSAETVRGAKLSFLAVQARVLIN